MWLVKHTNQVRLTGACGPAQVWALAGEIVLCSWVRHFITLMPLSTQVYK